MAVGGGGKDDRPPTPPPGVHEHVKEKPSYPQMMASLIDEVKKEVDEKKHAPEAGRLDQFIAGLQSHKDRIEDMQRQLLEKLAELEKEEKKHITSDDLHEGFNYSSVQHSKPSTSTSTSTSAGKKKEESVELLNPGRPEPSRTTTGDSGAEADVEEGGEIDDDSTEASPIAKKFAKIPSSDYRELLAFIMQHPSLLGEKETDGLLVEAFNSEMEGKHKHARTCVHQGLLLQYCRQLGGKDGVQLFFKRITTPGHQANKLFHDDVDSTYGRIKSRVAEILRQRAENPEGEGVEQIQLHAVDPNTTINIQVPPKTPTATDPQEREIEGQARAIFDSFPPGLQRALESGSLDEVNKVLAKMSVEEAEEIVEKLGNGGMLSLEQGVIDATTEEGKKAMEEIEKTHRMPGQKAEELGEPGPSVEEVD